MGAWGHKPLENDVAQDLLGDFNDSGDISILEASLDAVSNLQDSAYLEADVAEQAVAAAKIISDLDDDQLRPEERNRLSAKVNKALQRILEKSELKDLWQESPEYNEWAKCIEELKSQG